MCLKASVALTPPLTPGEAIVHEKERTGGWVRNTQTETKLSGTWRGWEGERGDKRQRKNEQEHHTPEEILSKQLCIREKEGDTNPRRPSAHK